MSAAWPHVMGILSGHAYHYYTNISPKDKLASVFRVPKWFRRLLVRLGLGDYEEGGGASNIPGLAARRPAAKPSYRQSIFGRNPVLPHPKGRKLSAASISSSEGRGKNSGKK
jgi:hypothetical protein